MRRTLLPLAALAITVGCNDVASNPTSPSQPRFASSSNPHFINKNTSAVVSPNPDLSVSYKIAGIGSGVTILITSSAVANLSEECLTKNQLNHPQAANKEFKPTPVAHSGYHTADAGGNIVATDVLEFPSGGLSCPPGQILSQTGFWSDVQINVPAQSDKPAFGTTIPGTFSVSL